MLVGVLLFWLALRGQDPHKIWDGLKQANYWWALASLVFAMLSNLSRAIRWNMLIEPLGYRPKVKNTFCAVMIAYFINLVIPRAGEVSRCAVVNRYEKVPLESLLGTVVAERVVDVLSLLLILLFVIFSQFNLMIGFFRTRVADPLGNKISALFGHGPLVNLLMVAFVLALLAGGWALFRRFKGSTKHSRLLDLFKGFADGLRTLGKLKNRNWFLFHTAFIWLAYVLMAYMVFFAVPATSHISFLAAISVMVFGGLGFVVPSPGGSGSYQFFVANVLLLYGISNSATHPDADIFALISWSTQTIAVIVFGALCFILLPVINPRKNPATS